MNRKTMRPIAIAASDFHLRMDVPKCRDEQEFLESQWRKLSHISRRSATAQVPILVAGDIFHRARPAGWARLILSVYEIMKTAFRWVLIPGNHDLPNHSIDSWKDSAFGVLAELLGEKVTVGEAELGQFFHLRLAGSAKVALSHTYVQDPSEEAPPWAVYKSKHSAADDGEWDEKPDVVVTGDNHKSFSFRKDGILWINPGAMTRQNTGEIDLEPSYYVLAVDDKTETIRSTRERYPFDKSAVFVHHSDSLNELPGIKEFIEKIKADYQYGISLEEMLRRNPPEDPLVRKVLMEALEEALSESESSEDG